MRSIWVARSLLPSFCCLTKKKWSSTYIVLSHPIDPLPSETNLQKNKTIVEDMSMSIWIREVKINSVKITQVADWVTETLNIRKTFWVRENLKIEKHNKLQSLHFIKNLKMFSLEHSLKHGTKYDRAAPGGVQKTNITVTHLKYAHKFVASWLYRELGFSSNNNLDLGGFSV